MGAPFVFRPAAFRTASGQREPADLFWVSNSCLILMYLKESKHFQASVENNLQQAAGFLRLWEGGRDLQGSNQYGDISLAANQLRHVVVLSVVDSPDSIAIYHPPDPRYPSVVAWATLPMAAMLRLLSNGGSAVDLLTTIKVLRDSPDLVVESGGFSDLVDWYRRACWRKAGAFDMWPAPADIDDRFYHARNIIHGCRAPESAINPLLVGMLHGITEPLAMRAEYRSVAATYNDMNLTDYLRVICEVVRQVDHVRDRAENSRIILPAGSTHESIGVVGLRFYNVAINAYYAEPLLRGGDGFTRLANRAWEILPERTDGIPNLLHLIPADPRPPGNGFPATTVQIPGGPHKSFTEGYLDKWSEKLGAEVANPAE
jgi:hypothetical protein